MSDPISMILNQCTSSGIFPDLLKEAIIIPIFQKGDKLLEKNYRPISLLSNISKIFEKALYSRLYGFFDKNNCLYNLQFGFRNSHSATHALINITEKIREAIDRKEFACGVFLDFQKAFDTVNIPILLGKLKHYGIRGLSLKLLESYLTNRKHRLK